MKVFLHLIVACLAIGARSDVINRHPHPMKAVLVNVKNEIESVHSSVRSFKGDDKPVVLASEKLVSALTAGKVAVDASKPVSGVDSFNLQEPMMDLIASGMSLSGYLKTRRPDVVKAGLCDEVNRLVTDINTASQAFIESVINKFPDLVQSIARNMARELIDELDETQEYFSAINCKNGSGGGGGVTSISTSVMSSRPASSSVPIYSPPSSTSGSTPSVLITTGSSAYTSVYSSVLSSTTSPTTGIPKGTTRTSTRITSSASSGTTALEPTSGSTGVPPQVTGGAPNLVPAGALAMAAAAILL